MTRRRSGFRALFSPPAIAIFVSTTLGYACGGADSNGSLSFANSHAVLASNLLSADFDHDKIPDMIEIKYSVEAHVSVDVDHDGIVNAADADADGDNVPDTSEGVVDLNHNGIPANLDPSEGVSAQQSSHSQSSAFTVPTFQIPPANTAGTQAQQGSSSSSSSSGGAPAAQPSAPAAQPSAPAAQPSAPAAQPSAPAGGVSQSSSSSSQSTSDNGTNTNTTTTSGPNATASAGNDLPPGVSDAIAQWTQETANMSSADFFSSNPQYVDIINSAQSRASGLPGVDAAE